MPKITGRVEVIVNGSVYLNKSGASASGIGISGEPSFERKPVHGDGGLHGFTEEPVDAMCEIPLTDREDISLSEIAALTDATLIFRAARGGKIYTLNNAFSKQNFTVTGGEGEVGGVSFIGAYWTEGTQ